MNELAKTFNPEDLNSQFIGKTPQTMEEKAVIFNATNNPTHKLSDYINKVIYATNVYIQPAQLTNRETGEVSIVPRIILIDNNNESYAAASFGLYHALERLFLIIGGPSEWKDPVPLEIKQVPTSKGSMLTFNLITN